MDHWYIRRLGGDQHRRRQSTWHCQGTYTPPPEPLDHWTYKSSMNITWPLTTPVAATIINIRGAIKTFSVWPISVQNKIKIVFASYSSKAQNTTCTIWLLGYKYFVHFSSHRLFAFDMEKTELRSVMKWQFWPIRSFHCMLCCSDSESKLQMHVSS